jgi:uncharacterized protein YbaP (TraB family)
MRLSVGRFKCFFLFATLLGVLALVTRPAGGQDVAKQGPERCFLWKVSSKTTTVYLLGSMHVAKADLFPLPKEIEDAFAKSAKLVVEVDTEAADKAKMQQLVLQKAKYADGESLSKGLSKKTMESLEKYCAKKGIPVANLEPFRPWFVSVVVSVQEITALGFGDNGIDKHFLKKAKAEKKPIVDLETIDAQMNLFTDLTPDFQDKLLAKTLSEAGEIKSQMEKMTAAWKAGDAKAMNNLMVGDTLKQHPEMKGLMAKIFDERNVKMVEKIDEMLKGTDSCFVVVGAGHLVGEKGIVKLLEEKKYQVEQVMRAAATQKAP